MPAAPTFALFVSCVEGRLVTRYGTASRGTPSFIGARRGASEPTEIVWDPELVVALTTEEVARYRREYARELEAKNLRRRTEAEYRAQLDREAPPPPAATPPAQAPAAPPSPPSAELVPAHEEKEPKP